ncbi:sodium/proline symporter [Candidatus Babeliales bacterium]|nr:sodium/proline symporter [Candidatus Babeliales bacterium]
MQALMLFAFLTYFTILFFIALASRFATKIVKKDADWLILGDRSLNFWLTAMSAHASDMSDWLFMGFPALIFVFGFSKFWAAIGLIIYMFLNWHFIAPKIRIETVKYKSSTLASYFENRFADHSGILRLTSAVITLVFFTVYIAAGFRGIGLIFESAFNFNYVLGIFLSVFIVMAYTMIGGFVAIAWTDFFQAMFLLAMIILVPTVAYFHVGGFFAIKTAVFDKGISLALLPDYSFKSIAGSLLLAFGWGLGYFGMPHILTKFMGIKNPEEIKKSKYLGITWQILSLSAAGFVGVVAVAFFKNKVIEPELIFIEMTKSLFNPFVAGIILCAIFAATISTIDSQVLVLASTITEDFYKNLFNKKSSQKNLVWTYRIGIVAVCLIAAFISMNRFYTVHDLVTYAWGGLGSSFSALVLFALYSKKINKYGAISGMLVGCLIGLIWTPFLNFLITSYTILAVIPGFILSLITSWFVSSLTERN